MLQYWKFSIYCIRYKKYIKRQDFKKALTQLYILVYVLLFSLYVWHLCNTLHSSVTFCNIFLYFSNIHKSCSQVVRDFVCKAKTKDWSETNRTMLELGHFTTFSGHLIANYIRVLPVYEVSFRNGMPQFLANSV